MEPRLTPSARNSLALFSALSVAAHGEQQGSARTQVTGNQFRVAGAQDSDFRMTQSGFIAGVDSAQQVSNYAMLMGVFTGYSNSRLNFSAGSTGTINNVFMGAYNTWLLNDGWCADAVVRASNLSTRAEVRMSDGSAAKGGFSTPGFGVSLELGRHRVLSDGWFTEPPVSASSMWVRGAAMKLDNCLLAQSGTTESRQAAFNLVTGKNLMLDNGTVLQPWLKVAAIVNLPVITMSALTAISSVTTCRVCTENTVPVSLHS